MKSFSTTRDLKPSEITFKITTGLDEETLHKKQLFNIGIIDLEFSVHTFNALIDNQIATIGQLASYNRDDLAKIKGFTKKVMTELDDKLTSLGLSFGTDLSTYESRVESKNIFDTDSIRLRYVLNTVETKGGGGLGVEDLTILDNFSKAFGLDWLYDSKQVTKLLNA